MFEDEYSRYWKTVVQTMLDGLMVVDPEGVIISVNNAFEKLTGYSEKELIGQSSDVLACESCLRAKALGTLQPWEIESQAVCFEAKRRFAGACS